MNLERYKAEMSRGVPDRRFVEETLSSLKGRHKTAPHRNAVLKAAGGIGLSAAVLVGAFFTAGAVRSLFADIEPVETENDIIEETPIVNETEVIDKIIATDNELSLTPLSNPKYTVKVNTDNGRVSMNEDTTVTEMLACGVPVITENGTLGMEYFCKALKDYKDGKAFEFVVGDAAVENQNGYFYYNVKSNGCSKYWEYVHRNYLSVNKYSNDYEFAAISALGNETVSGIILHNNYYSRLTQPIGIVTMHDLLRVTGYDKEERKAMFYKNMTQVYDNYSPVLSIIYNGECLGKFRMNNFIENIENGAQYAAVQYTDITTTTEYDERFYSIEYCDGVYSIFTMTDGLGGVLKTEYFDGYKVEDNKVIFDNGEISYSFDLSLTPDEDEAFYGEKLSVRDDMTEGWFWSHSASHENPLTLDCDRAWIVDVFRNNITDWLEINEEYSSEGIYAVRLLSYKDEGDYRDGILAVKDGLFAKNNAGIEYSLAHLWVVTDDGSWRAVLMPDGNYYALFNDEDIQNIRYSSISLMRKGLKYSIGMSYDIRNDPDRMGNYVFLPNGFYGDAEYGTLISR